MFNIDSGEFLVVAIAALIFIGPKDLPRAMHFVGKWVGKARGVARQFRSGIDSMVREAELAELEKQWAAENERIMRQYPPQPLPAPDALPAAEIGEAHDAPVMTPQPELRPDPVPVSVSAPAPSEAAAHEPKAVAMIPPTSETSK